MTENNKFINQKIINKSNEEGIVTSFDDEHIVVQYPHKTTTYNTKVVLEKQFIVFASEEMKQEVINYLNGETDKQNQQKAIEQKNYRIAVYRHKALQKLYKTLKYKDKVYKSLFGSDFDYPPLVEFVKKYKPYLERETIFYRVGPIGLYNCFDHAHRYFD